MKPDPKPYMHGDTENATLLAWLGQWRDSIPADAVRSLQDIIGVPVSTSQDFAVRARRMAEEVMAAGLSKWDFHYAGFDRGEKYSPFYEVGTPASPNPGVGFFMRDWSEDPARRSEFLIEFRDLIEGLLPEGWRIYEACVFTPFPHVVVTECTEVK